jgi:hypothetical protein
VIVSPKKTPVEPKKVKNDFPLLGNSKAKPKVATKSTSEWATIVKQSLHDVKIKQITQDISQLKKRDECDTFKTPIRYSKCLLEPNGKYDISDSYDPTDPCDLHESSSNDEDDT